MNIKERIIHNVIQEMLPFLNNSQSEKLKKVLSFELENIEFSKKKKENLQTESNSKLLEVFISAKRVEGCSEKSLGYYRTAIEKMIAGINKPIKEIITDDLRIYLTDYQEKKSLSRMTIDNMRRIFSSFFSWLEDEDYILKSPVRRIHKIKSATVIKETYTDESLEIMRDNCKSSRDLALIDILASTGMRIGELVLLNKEDINFNERECIVFGKGNKERIVYFDARTKIHLKNYFYNGKENKVSRNAVGYLSWD